MVVASPLVVTTFTYSRERERDRDRDRERERERERETDLHLPFTSLTTIQECDGSERRSLNYVSLIPENGRLNSLTCVWDCRIMITVNEIKLVN